MNEVTRAIETALKLSQNRDAKGVPSAQPGPVACEPLSGAELDAVISDWLARPPDTCPRTELARMAAAAQLAKVIPVSTAPAKTATPALDALIDEQGGEEIFAPLQKAEIRSAYEDDLARDTAGLRAELDTDKRAVKDADRRAHDLRCATDQHKRDLVAAKAELAEAKRQRDEKLSNDSGEWLREYQAACARERGLVAENEKLAASLREARRHGREDENAVHTAKE